MTLILEFSLSVCKTQSCFQPIHIAKLLWQKIKYPCQTLDFQFNFNLKSLKENQLSCEWFKFLNPNDIIQTSVELSYAVLLVLYALGNTLLTTSKGKKVQYYKSLHTRQSYYFEGAAHNHNGLPYFQPSTFLSKLSCSPHFFFLVKTPKKTFGLLFASVFEEKGLFMHSQAEARKLINYDW